MANITVLDGKPLVNIARAEIITEEQEPKVFIWDTASTANIAPEVSEGAEDILRTKNTIHAVNRTEDIVVGYNLDFSDNLFTPEVFALVDGGTLIYEDDPSVPSGKRLSGYIAPVAGQVVERQLFTLNIYTEEKDVDGEATGYAKFTYLHCKGKPAEYTIEDGTFMVSTLTMTSRPKKCETPVEITFLKSLPEIPGGGGTICPPPVTPKSSEKAFLTFAVDGVSGTIDEENKTILVQLPTGDPVTALAPTFTVSPKARVEHNGAVQESGVTTNDFTTPLEYIVIAEDETTASYAVTVES